MRFNARAERCCHWKKVFGHILTTTDERICRSWFPLFENDSAMGKTRRNQVARLYNLHLRQHMQQVASSSNSLEESIELSSRLNWLIKRFFPTLEEGEGKES